MNWTKIWLDLFGTTTLWGIDMGFWVSLGVVALIVILMNAIFWSLKPKKQTPHADEKEDLCKEEKIKRDNNMRN